MGEIDESEDDVTDDVIVNEVNGPPDVPMLDIPEEEDNPVSEHSQLKADGADSPGHSGSLKNCVSGLLKLPAKHLT